MNKVIAYGCVTSGFHSTKSADKISETDAQWRLNTKIADEIKKLKNLFIPEDIIRIDVIDSIRRHRKHLEDALRTMSYGDTIIIASLSSLGLNNDELVKNYKRIFDARIGLLLPDYGNANGLSTFATTNFGFAPITISGEEFSELCRKLSFEEVRSYRGRKKVDVSDEFKTIYWMYERYAIDPTTACKNKFFAMSKNTFRRLCDDYESSEEYDADIAEQEALYKISKLPKRYGAVSAEAEALIRAMERGTSFEDACVMFRIEINMIQFARYFLKFYLTKKDLVKATNEYRDYDLIGSLQPVYDKTS